MPVLPNLDALAARYHAMPEAFRSAVSFFNWCRLPEATRRHYEST